MLHDKNMLNTYTSYISLYITDMTNENKDSILYLYVFPICLR